MLNLNDYLEHSKIVAYYYQCHSKSVYCSASILQTTPTVVPIQGANPTGDSSDCYCSATNFQASNAVHFVSIHTLPKVMSSQTDPAPDYLIPTRLHRSVAPSDFRTTLRICRALIPDPFRNLGHRPKEIPIIMFPGRTAIYSCI